MKGKFIALLTLVFTAQAGLFAQNHSVAEDHFECGIFEATEAYFEAHPEALAAARAEEEQLEAFTANYRENPSREDEIYVIPVVFHIIHQNGIENISNEQIYDAIDVLNEDYSATNPGLPNVLEQFEDRIANVGFEFRLARLDPEGNCTNGIIRTYSETTFSGGENLKVVSPSWDRSSYLNIWVCHDIENGAAGYSQYPYNVTGPFGAQTDGIVVLYNYVGSIAPSNDTRSHTLSHEVGHWANLIHPWGNSNEPGVASNCNIDDQVSDTPNTIGYTTCNLNGTSCGSLDNVQNFMDYSYCSEMFTEGQKTRMRAAMNSSTAGRNQLWTEANLIETGVAGAPTLCHADFKANATVVCVGTEVTFEDMSFNGVADWDWTFEGGSPASSTASQPVVTYSQPGTYTVSLTVSDQANEMTKTKTSYIHVLAPEQEIGEYFQDFEEFTSTDNNGFNWFSISADGNNQVRWKLTSEAAYSGNKSFYVNGRENADNYQEYLDSPVFDLTGLNDGTEDAVLTFKYAHKRRTGATDDRLRVQISRNCGESWITRLELAGSELPTVDGNSYNAWFPDSQSEWDEVVIDNITPIYFTEDFRVRFEFTSYKGNNIFIDDINLHDGALVGIGEVSNPVSAVDIYPNPADGDFEVSVKATSNGNLAIELFDLAGRKLTNLYNGSLQAQEFRQRFSPVGLSAGIYLVKVTLNGQPTVSKLVIR